MDGDNLALISEGDAGRFVDEARLTSPRPVQVRRIAAAASDTLDNWVLASVHGGEVASRPDGQKAMAEHAVFEVVATVSPEASAMQPVTELRGELQIRGAA